MKESKISSIQLLYTNLENLIKSDRYAVGDKFLTELEICEQFGVGRSTVREATRILQAHGYLEIKHGSGTYIKSKSKENQAIGNWLLDNKDKLRDYMDVRIAIEVLSVRLFIKRSTDEKINELEMSLKEFEQTVENDDAKKMSIMDEAFHAAIAKGSENDLLIEFNRLLSDSFREYRQSTFLNKDTRSAAVTAHRNIMDSIRRRDTNEAVYNIQGHLTESLENAIAQFELL